MSRKTFKLANFLVEFGDERKFFLIRKDGQKDPTPYDYIRKEALADGFFEVVFNDKSGIVNSDGEVIISPSFDLLLYGAVVDGIPYFPCCKKRESEIYGLVSQGGKVILDFEWEKIEIIHSSHSIEETGWFFIKRNEKWGYFNVRNGKKVAPIFDELKTFQNGYAPFKMNNLWGCIDESGEIIIEPKYGFEFNFNSDGFALVQEGGYFEKVYGSKKFMIMNSVTKVITPNDLTILSKYTPMTYALSTLGNIREESLSSYRIIEDGESIYDCRTIATKKLIPLDDCIVILSNGEYEDFNLCHYISGGSLSALDYDGKYVPITDEIAEECKKFLKRNS